MGDGPPDSDGISRVRRTQDPLWRESHFNYGCYRLGGPFQTASFITFFCNPYRVPTPQEASFLVWALSVSLAATQEIDFLSLPPVLRCSVPGLLPHAMYSRKDTIRLKIVGSPFGNLWINAYVQPPSISVLVPSFFGS
ncbi:hypothetical protein CEQ29_000095 [Listeria monocytogenes]|nr:hypothetical protein CEQ29_000095 [Listeria monocytogenes]